MAYTRTHRKHVVLGNPKPKKVHLPSGMVQETKPEAKHKKYKHPKGTHIT